MGKKKRVVIITLVIFLIVLFVILFKIVSFGYDVKHIRYTHNNNKLI